MPSLSAGRVQSVAVRLIVEREIEIQNFVSQPYYRVTAQFTEPGCDHIVSAELNTRLQSIEEANAFLEKCKTAVFSVGDIEVHDIRKSPAPPFTTSTLQQEASRKLGFSVSQTMSVAQRLYENGHITYMRTDSVNLSDEALSALEQLIKERAGEQYYKHRKFHTASKGAQEAHEAIRPTYIDKEELTGASAQEQRLYTLIRRRTIASQMADALIKKTTVDIAAPTLEHHFSASDETVEFDGFLRVYTESLDDDEPLANENRAGKALSTGQKLVYKEIDATERYTMQPPRYTEASLVKKMEELGIGRPSTYAPTISTIQQRGYVERGESEGEQRDFTTLSLANGNIEQSSRSMLTGGNKGRLVPTDIGMTVNSFLTEYFPDILDYNFTANIEERFDEIAHGKLQWGEELSRFYILFHPAVVNAQTIQQGHKFGERILGEEPGTGQPVSVKIGRFGPVVQIGSSEDEAKPRFASLLKGQSLATITLEEALKLFEFPHTLGTFEDSDVIVAIGRFGPYVRHKGKFVSIPKDEEPAAISLEEAIGLIMAKREADEQKHLLSFDEDPDIQVLKGRFGPYISYKKKNYKLPKSVKDPSTLSYEEVRKIIDDSDTTPAKPRRSTTKRKK